MSKRRGKGPKNSQKAKQNGMGSMVMFGGVALVVAAAGLWWYRSRTAESAPLQIPMVDSVTSQIPDASVPTLEEIAASVPPVVFPQTGPSGSSPAGSGSTPAAPLVRPGATVAEQKASVLAQQKAKAKAELALKEAARTRGRSTL